MVRRATLLLLSFPTVAACDGCDDDGRGGAGGGSSTTGPSSDTTGAGGAAGGTVRALAIGRSHSCVLYEDGGVACWGLDVAGELGRGTAGSGGPGPARATVFDGATGLGSGWSTTCARDAAGSMFCWGTNSEGQLGDGSVSTSSPAPVAVLGLTAVEAIAAGGSRTCAIVGGGVRCWGDNQFRQLGDGTTMGSPTPVSVIGLTGVVELDLSQTSHHACARTGASVMCWGFNGSGQLGTTTPGGFADTPVAFGAVDDATAIATGEHHTCAVRASGSVVCAGAGPLGDGTDMSSVVPVDVQGLGDAVELAAGDDFTCARRAGRTVSCWGRNDRGQLGDGSTTEALVPVAVAGLSGVVEIDAGSGHTCALTQDRAVYCWGDGEYGQTGVDMIANPSPVVVAGL
jgi:alpha-tubulin suppressor-like RCC1 family protein